MRCSLLWLAGGAGPCQTCVVDGAEMVRYPAEFLKKNVQRLLFSSWSENLMMVFDDEGAAVAKE